MLKQPNQPFLHFSIGGFMAFGMVLGATIGANENAGFFEFISKWNAIIGSAVAIFAAWIAFGNSTRQIAATIQIKQDEIYRENRAARAALNSVLSDICRYSRLSIQYIEERRHGSKEEAQLPDLSSNIVNILEKNIRFSLDTHVDALAKLTSDLQVQRARLEDRARSRDFLKGHYADEAIYDALNIYSQASNLFNYSRFHESSDHQMSLHSALRANARHIRHRDSIREIIVRRTGEETRPAAESPAAGQ